MLKFNVKLDVPMNEIQSNYQKAIERTQYILDEQILKDSNYYIPMDERELMNSSLRASEVGNGLLRWDTPYARRLYYNPQYNFQKDENPNASGLWFEKAKAYRAPEWNKLANNTFKENF